MAETSSEETKDDANRRVLLPVYYERINHLADLISNLNGFIIAILVGIIVGNFAINTTSGYGEEILTLIGLLSIIVWRKKAHDFDKEIQGVYHLIISCEEKLEIEEEFLLIKRGERLFCDRGHYPIDLLAYFLGIGLLEVYNLQTALFKTDDSIVLISSLTLIGMIVYGFFMRD